MVMTKTEAFKILECETTATVDEIRSCYKKLALRWHPDKHSNSQEATSKFQEISEAYKRLTSKDDNDDIHITMGDMFDLFAHIFFANGTYFSATRGTNHHHRVHIHMPYMYDHYDYGDDDDEFITSSESSDNEETIHVAYNMRGRSKYSDFARPTTSTTTNKTTYKNVRNNVSEAEAMKNAEELIKEEEQKKKKAEKKRAKKKRTRAKRKEKEKGQQTVNNNNHEEKECDEENEEKPGQTTSQGNKKQHSHRTTNKKKMEDSGSEADEVCWDTSSAFFANAARRGPTAKPCTATATAGGEPSTSSSETSSTVNMTKQKNIQSTRAEKQQQEEEDENQNPIVIKSRELAVKGNNLANEGKYAEAVEYFTRAINLHNTDFRFFGNRSYCYDRLGEYHKALLDADVTTSLAPGWPKGYFRRGRALAGMKRYAEAETAFTQVLQLDKRCDDAKFELTRTRVEQLKDMGFAHAQSERAVRLYGNVQAALDAMLAGKVQNVEVTEENRYISDEEMNGNEPRIRNEDMCSLWVGNIDPKETTERQLVQLFSKCGPIKFIRILSGSYCAFVNYENKDSATKALQYLQGYSIGGQNIKLRYPNTEKSQKSVPSSSAPTSSSAPEPPQPPAAAAAPAAAAVKITGPVNGEECYFWRTTGCAYGNKCRFVHIPAQKGVDLEKVEQKYGKTKPVRKGR